MLTRLALLMAVAMVPGFCQVQVDLRTNQANYLAGEPIFVVVDVKNIGTESIGYALGFGHTDLTVPGGPKKQPPNLSGCFAGYGGGAGGGVDHPPMMKPGQTVSFWYLLRGYKLGGGEYLLNASGQAGVIWKYYPGPGSPVPPKHSEKDPVEGAMFARSMKLSIQIASEEALRQRYAPYVADAEGWDMERRTRAREAIAEMAPPFLEKTLLGFANQPETAHLAVEGLGQIPTTESRSDLVALFDMSADLRLRAEIVQKLAGIGTVQEVPFFSSLLAGRSTALDDEIHNWAALGLGHIGGTAAVKSLENVSHSLDPKIHASVAMALGNTKDPGAIPVLIEMYSDPVSAVCPALITLTHYQWCSDNGGVAETQARWRSWWRSHAAQLTLYSADQCPASGTSLPVVN